MLKSVKPQDGERKNQKKRRSLDEKKGDSSSSKKQKKGEQILAGTTLAVSTLQEESTDGSELSYNQVAEILRGCGARVSGQVHKKVECVLCTEAAIRKATQRVRKAQKKKIPLVEIEWLHKSIEKNEKLPFDGFLLDYPGDEEQQQPKKSTAEEDGQSVGSIDPNAGWTEPVDVGCCCVCHELGTEADCEWCTDCKGV